MKLLDSIVGTLRGRREAKQAEALGSYSDILRRLADETLKEDAIDPKRLEELLDGAGKTLDDLQRDVLAIKRRHAMAGEVARLPALREQLAATRAEQVAANERGATLQREIGKLVSEVIPALGQRESKLIDAIGKTMAAEQELLDKCPDEALVSEQQKLSDRRRDLRADLKMLDRELDDYHHDTLAGKLRLRSERLSQAQKTLGRPGLLSRLKAEIDELVPQVERMKARRPQVVAELAELERAEAELKATILAV